MRILRQPEVLARTGFSAMTLWRKQNDRSFPMRVRLGPNSVGWVEEEVAAWVAARVAERDTAEQPPQAAE